MFLLGEGVVALDGSDVEGLVGEDAAAAAEDDVSVAHVTGVIRSSLRDLPMPPAATVVGDAITAPLPRVVVASTRIVSALAAHVSERYVDMAPRFADLAKVAHEGAPDELEICKHMVVLGEREVPTRRGSRCIY